MFGKIFRRRGGNLHDDTIDSGQINVSDSAPILNNRRSNNNSNNLDFTFSHASIHDLRSTSDGEVTLVKRSLRTIPGVFCPVALSMCSVAVFMRIGFIVGHAGILHSIGLYALAFLIFVLTGLSVCAISTNGAIQGGGVYCKSQLLVSSIFKVPITSLKQLFKEIFWLKLFIDFEFKTIYIF